MNNQYALELIKNFEGCRLAAYQCPAGVWTIGWGRTKGVGRGDTITQDQADAYLALEYQVFQAGVVKALNGYPTTVNQLGAMTSFAYNLGLGSLRSSTLFKLHLAGDYAGAAKQFARWNKANGKTLAGLTKRRAAEAALYLSRT